MKLELLTAICDGKTFEEVVDFAAENHLECQGRLLPGQM